MAMNAEELESLIKAALPDAQVAIEELRGDGDHYAALVTSSAFTGKSRVERQRLVYAALAGELANQIHALSLITRTPEESS